MREDDNGKVALGLVLLGATLLVYIVLVVIVVQPGVIMANPLAVFTLVGSLALVTIVAIGKILWMGRPPRCPGYRGWRCQLSRGHLGRCELTPAWWNAGGARLVRKSQEKNSS